jgi:hypothetical protein
LDYLLNKKYTLAPSMHPSICFYFNFAANFST